MAAGPVCRGCRHWLGTDIYTHHPRTPLRCLAHSSSLCILRHLSHAHTCLGNAYSFPRSHRMCKRGTWLAVLARVGCWESVPRDMPANPGVLMHSHTSSPASLGVPREPLGPWVQDGGDAGDASCSPKSMKKGVEGGISCFSFAPRCFCCPLQLPGWKPVHSGPGAALYLQVSAACVSSQEQEPRQLEALLELVGEGRGCLCSV